MKNVFSLPFFALLLAFFTLTPPATAADLAVEVIVNQQNAQKFDTIEATVRVLNQGKTKVSGVVLQLAFSDGLNIVSVRSDAGIFNQKSGVWKVEEISERTEYLALRVELAIAAEGPLAIQAEITRQNEPDKDSTPGNTKMGEDDLNFGYVTVPIVFCGSDPVKLSAEAFGGFTGYQWLRDGKKIPGATDKTLEINQVGRYTCQVNETNQSDAASFPVIVRQAPKLAASLREHYEICAGETLKLRPNPNGGTPPYRFDWENSIGFDLSQPLKGDLEFEVTVRVSDRAGCDLNLKTRVKVASCEKE